MVRHSPRPTAEVQRLVLHAARELFAAQGYEATTTRDIAKQAGVVPSQLFAQFGTKATLFEQAVITPYADVINAYVLRWDGVSHEDVDTVQLCRDIMVDLFQVFLTNSGLIASLVLAQEHSPELEAELRSCRDAVNGVLAPVERFTTEEAIRRGYTGIDTPTTVRLNHGTVLAAALFGVFDDRVGGPPADELARLLTEGFVPERGGSSTVAPPGPPSGPASGDPGEVLSGARLRLVDSARESFCRNGYTRTGTRTLAAAANTSQTVIFRHFGSKQDLFDESVVGSWERVLDDAVAQTRARRVGDDPLPEFRTEVAALVELFIRHRGLLLALLETRTSNDRSAHALNRTFGELSGLLRERFAPSHHPDDPTLPLILCMIVGATVLDGWVFTGTARESEWVAGEVSRLALRGLTHQN